MILINIFIIKIIIKDESLKEKGSILTLLGFELVKINYNSNLNSINDNLPTINNSCN